MSTPIAIRSARIVLVVEGKQITFEFDAGGRRTLFAKGSPVNASEVHLSSVLSDRLDALLSGILKWDHPAIVPDPPEATAPAPLAMIEPPPPGSVGATLAEIDPELLTADGFDMAILGVAARCGMEPVVVYDRAKCLEILMAKGDIGLRSRRGVLRVQRRRRVRRRTNAHVHDADRGPVARRDQ
jgi:hypothetical protein